VQIAGIEFRDTTINLMNKITKNKLAMYRSLRTVLTSQEAEWSVLPAFASAVQTFASRLGALEQSMYQQNIAMVGVSAVRDAKKSIVADKAYAMSSAMVAYGVVNNDVELINHVKIARHKLLYAPRDLVIVLVDRILIRATSLIGLLDAYGVDQASVNELQLLRDELGTQMNAPRNAILDRKGETERISSLVKEIDAILKFQLDTLIRILKEDHPDLFIAYTNARVIVDHRNRNASSGERDDGGTNPPPSGSDPVGSPF
jgi:hypothetical protein